MGEFRMPALGADMEEGKLVEWLVKPGDYVHRGDMVAVIDTDKADIDVESFEDGVVAELLVEVGTTVPVGGVLARITQTPAAGAAPAGPSAAGPAHPAPAPTRAGAEPTRPPRPAPKHPVAGRTATAPVRETAPVSEASPEPAGFVSPPVRRLAHGLGVDIARLHGTGRNGAVTRADVEAAVRGPAPGEPAIHRVRSSPRARRLAVELGVDLAAVRGTGPEGAVTEADIRNSVGVAAERRAAEESATAEPAEQPAEKTAEQPAPGKTRPPGREPREAADRAESLRRAIGTLMTRSKKTIPHYYLSTTLDLQAALSWMEEANLTRPITARLVPAALLLKSAAMAAREVPEVNGFFTDGAFHPSAAVHLGVAVALRRGGLVAPAIHDADTLGLDLLMERLRDLVGRARAGRLQRAEMADPTITVTNLGDLGVESVFGVIYPPQVALVGLGRVLEQPFARNGLIGVRPIVTATLSADHRVSDGLRGGRFLARMNELLQKPEEL